MIKILIILFLFTPYHQCIAQDVLSDITLGDPMDATGENNIFGETINIISKSHKIFILSNLNQKMFKGDFITILIDDKSPAARAVVAKNHENEVGIKILKIYSLKNWNKLKKNLPVKIIRGDDSYVFSKKNENINKSESEKLSEKIESEEDLYNDKFLDNEGEFATKDNRLIKPDNVVGLSLARPVYYNTDNEPVFSNEVSGHWAYQFLSNFWLEGMYSYASLPGFPMDGNKVTVNTMSGRVKYTIQAPFNSYFLPFVGFRTITANNTSTSRVITQSDKNKIDAVINDINKNEFTFGATFLIRTVPGWFLKADLGINTFNIGFSVEF